MNLYKVFLVLLLIVFLPQQAVAEHYALLVGVKEYDDSSLNLQGPENDVNSLKELLTGNYGFHRKNIESILSRNAYKANIIAHLRKLQKTTQSGDYIFLYFSGHGTSAFDPEFKTLDTTTGAIVPFDFKLDRASPQTMMDSLIIGKRDIFPVLKELEHDRRVFVVFDACFSGNAVRSLGAVEASNTLGKSKYINTGLTAEAHSSSSKPAAAYPYKNVLYISASDKTETARDLSTGSDGLAHGALTDTMIIGLKGAADTNNDGVITYEELYNYLRRNVSKDYGQTPQLLRNKAFDINLPVFDNTKFKEEAYFAPQAVKEDSNLPRVKIVQDYDDLGRLFPADLSVVNGTAYDDEKYDLMIVRDGMRYLLALPNGDLLCSIDVKRKQDVVNTVKRYFKGRELLRLKNPNQKFNVWLNVGDVEGRTVFFEDETIDFTIKSESDAHLLLLNINPDGFVTVLLPDKNVPTAPIKRDVPIELRDLGKVGAPFGTEYIKVFAFKNEVKGLPKLINKTLMDPLGSDFAGLLQMIKHEQGWSETSTEMVTKEKQR
ncbi:MAG: caspase family protein [Nitrospirae bacterium]|nr:caspase family protein [Nitrospirota bacterium]MBF0536182.1 caspase family protein [Nitrospirota bacterium]MBF0618194.1 caspase family protein [Nitrospirota bacterium]